MSNPGNSIRKGKWEKLFVTGVLLLLMYFPIFSFLGTLPLRVWDESRLAVSAVEMTQSGNILEVTYQSEPDLWSTKPPLMIWLQALSIKIFGINELAVRLPSAVAAFLTCAVLFVFGFRYSGNIWLPAITVVFLITSQGYISLHGTRTGDYDSLLVLNSTAYLLCMYHFLQSGNKRYLYGFFIFLLLAVLTKGIAGFFMLPGLFIYLVINKKISVLLKLKNFYLGLGIFLTISAGYYGTREWVNPGYIKAVIENEITGRYLTNLENHAQPFAYYLNNFIDYRYAAYIPLVIIAMIGNIFITNRKLSAISSFCMWNILVYVLIISSGVSKLEHYDLPVYPLLALVTGIFIFTIFLLIEKISVQHNLVNGKFLSITFLLLLLYKPYNETFRVNVNPRDEGSAAHFYSPGHALKKIIRNPREFDELTIVHSDYSAHLDFYRHMLREKGIRSRYADATGLHSGDYALFPNQEELDKLPPDFVYEEIFTEKFAKLVRVIKVKSINKWAGNLEIIPFDVNCYQTCHPWTLQKLTHLKDGETAISAFTDFESGMNCEEFIGHVDTTVAYSGRTSAYMDHDHIYSASFRCRTKPFEHFDLIEISGKIKPFRSDTRIHVNVSVDGNGKNIRYYSKKVKTASLPQTNGWHHFTTYISPSLPYPAGSELLIYLNRESGDRVNIDDLRIVFMKSDK